MIKMIRKYNDNDGDGVDDYKQVLRIQEQSPKPIIKLIMCIVYVRDANIIIVTKGMPSESKTTEIK